MTAVEITEMSVKGLELKVPPAVWVLLYGWLMKRCCLWFPGWSFDLGIASVLAPVLVGLGLSVAYAGVHAFRQAKTTLNPMQPDKTSSVVETGIYAVTRNPMYVGMAILLSGWAVHLQNLAAFVMLGLFVITMTNLQIRPEEAVLEQRFGKAYRDYRQRVPRWLF